MHTKGAHSTVSGSTTAHSYSLYKALYSMFHCARLGSSLKRAKGIRAGVSNIDAQRGKYRHVFRMTDEDGVISSSCDCSKGTMLSTICLHIDILSEYDMESDPPMYHLEEPTSFLVSFEQSALNFSVASNSGSMCHHSHKRTIVTRKSMHIWNCQSCTERYPLLLIK